MRWKSKRSGENNADDDENDTKLSFEILSVGIYSYHHDESVMMMMIVINAASHWVAGPRGRGWVFSLPVEVLLGKDAPMLIFFFN